MSVMYQIQFWNKDEQTDQQEGISPISDDNVLV